MVLPSPRSITQKKIPKSMDFKSDFQNIINRNNSTSPKSLISFTIIPLETQNPTLTFGLSAAPRSRSNSPKPIRSPSLPATSRTTFFFFFSFFHASSSFLFFFSLAASPSLLNHLNLIPQGLN